MRFIPGHSFILALVLIISLFSDACLADRSIVVVVSSSVPVEQFTKQEVSSFFLGESSGSSLVDTAFDRNDYVLKGRFYRQVAGMSLNRLRAFWAKKVFTSRGRPPKAIEPDMIENRDAFGDSFITYMYEDELTDTFKVVYTLEAEAKEEQK
ncbi:MAG: hypothetical protein HKP55_13655 [Gammaproteobacteria bacterium]|nr:hypothetical protein [Gammaproteobacteria bacterium]